MSEKKKMGRPKSEDPKIYRVEVKFSKAELDILDALCVNKNLTHSELIRYLVKKAK